MMSTGDSSWSCWRMTRKIPMMKSVITKEKSFVICLHYTHFQFLKYNFYMRRGRFFSCDFHIVALLSMSVYIFSLLTKMFMASMSIDLFTLMICKILSVFHLSFFACFFYFHSKMKTIWVSTLSFFFEKRESWAKGCFYCNK